MFSPIIISGVLIMYILLLPNHILGTLGPPKYVDAIQKLGKIMPRQHFLQIFQLNVGGVAWGAGVFVCVCEHLSTLNLGSSSEMFTFFSTLHSINIVNTNQRMTEEQSYVPRYSV